jgi:hypothetical protein
MPLAVAAFCYAFAACGNAYPKQTKLSDSLVLWTSSTGCTFLVRGTTASGDFLLGPHIQTWQRRGHFVTGEVIHHADSSPDLTTSPGDVGYFILDLDTGSLTKGLQKPAFEQQVQSLALNAK